MSPSAIRSGVGCLEGMAGESSRDGRDLNGARNMRALPCKDGRDGVRIKPFTRCRQSTTARQAARLWGEDLQIRGRVREMRRISGHDASGSLAPSERGVE